MVERNGGTCWVPVANDGNPVREQHLDFDGGYVGVSCAYFEDPVVWEAFYWLDGKDPGYIGPSYPTEDEAKAAAEEWLGNWSKY